MGADERQFQGRSFCWNGRGHAWGKQTVDLKWCRNDEEKAGGLKHAGPLVEGSSPPSSESAWSKMLLEKGRDKSPEFASNYSEGRVPSRKSGH